MNTVKSVLKTIGISTWLTLLMSSTAIFSFVVMLVY